MRHCPICRRQYDDSVQFCPADAAKLIIVGVDEDRMVGAVIGGKYRIERKIGEGGMGKIYEARHVTLGKRFAVKTLHLDYTRNIEAIERFRREATTTAALEHPNILGMADMDQTDDGTSYIVMEFLDGHEFRDVLNRERILPLPRVVHIFSQVCRALHAAHEHGVVHRDLKPENVFLVRREDDPDFVKLLDFGISKIRAAGSKLTQTGMVIGTPHYMSPEQARGDPGLDNRSDIYAIGVMLYEALTGRLPVDAENPTGVLVKILTEEPLPPRAVNPAIPPEVEAIILRAMAKDKNHRFAACRDLLAALQQASGFASGATTAAAAPRPGPTPSQAYAGAAVAPTAYGTPPTAPPGQPGMQYGGPPAPYPPYPSGGAVPPTGPTPMAWPGQTQSAPIALPAPARRSAAPLVAVLLTLLVTGAAAAAYFLVFRERSGGDSGTAAAGPQAAVDAGIVLASADGGGIDPPVQASDAGVAMPVQADPPDVAVAAGPDIEEPEAAVAVADGSEPEAAAVPAEPDKVTVTFVTSPDGAKVFVVRDGSEEQICETTTCQHAFPKGSEPIRVVFRRAGYRDHRPPEFLPTQHRFVQGDLDRVSGSRRDAGGGQVTAADVPIGPPDAGVVVVRPPDAGVIVVPLRDVGGHTIRIEAGQGVQQIDVGGPRIW
ncbi:MAG: protein kinase [Myxococcota bacterium]|nr:protein kinase [Myxococcota bacterium]